MNHLNRQQLADIYTIAVIGASVDPAAAALARRIG